VRIRALRHEQHHEDQQHAVHDQVQAGEAARREVVARELRQWAQDERPEDRAEQRPGAAHDRADDDLDRQRDAEHGVRLDREEVERVEGAADAGEERRHDHGQHLVAEDGDAQRLAGGLVLTDRGQVDPEPAALDQGGHPRGAEHQGERDVVVGAGVSELELPRVAGERDVEPLRAADRLDVGRDDPAELRERRREEHEVEAAQAEAEAQVPDDRAQERREPRADEHADPRRDAVADREDR
jgi:hypothetical protein